MANYRTTRIIPTILVILVTVIAIVALISIARALFFSGSSTPAAVDTTEQALLSTSDSSSVSMSVRGPIVAQENFHSYSIVVSPTSRQITTYNGYLGTVVAQENLGNNTAAYKEFVNALNLAKMTAGNQPAEGEDNVQGVCATGRLSQFSILTSGQTVETLWTSTCSGSKGTLQANSTQLSNLFINQIPNAQSLIRKISL